MSKNAWKTLNAWKARKPGNIMELGAPGKKKNGTQGLRPLDRWMEFPFFGHTTISHTTISAIFRQRQL